jgi:hypothetical protein
MGFCITPRKGLIQAQAAVALAKVMRISKVVNSAKLTQPSNPPTYSKRIELHWDVDIFYSLIRLNDSLLLMLAWPKWSIEEVGARHIVSKNAVAGNATPRCVPQRNVWSAAVSDRYVE